jgi:hypothetical protein
MFVACVGGAAFFLYDHDPILSIVALGLAAFLGLRMFLRF